MPVPHGLIGVIHVPALPGDPRHLLGGFGAVERFAMTDADALASGGADAIIVENFGSVPFAKGDAGSRIPPHQVAFLALLAARIKAETRLPVGVNCLRNDAMSALGIAAAGNLDFIRVNVHTGAYLTDQGVIEGEAATSLRYRAALRAEQVAILADVLVKHATPLAPLDPATATKDTLVRGCADAVIVTGNATGGAVDRPLLDTVIQAANGAPTLIGSGLTPYNVLMLAPGTTGAIVGTWLKRDGMLNAPVDPERVRTMKSALTNALGRP